jgi:hypothetical protein
MNPNCRVVVYAEECPNQVDDVRPWAATTALRAEGLGFDRIAARLNEEGIPTRIGKPRHGVVVNRILTGKR